MTAESARNLRAILTAVLAIGGAAASAAGVVSQSLSESLHGLRDEQRVSVIVRFTDRADLSELRGLPPAQRRALLPQILREHAEATQEPVKSYLRAQGVLQVRTLWINNALAASVPAGLIATLARQPGVERLDLDAQVPLPAPVNGRN